MSVMEVELSDLRGWADLVERNGGYAAEMGQEATGVIADGDFGRILELVSHDYAALLPGFHQVLGVDGVRLDATAVALRGVARDFAETDRKVSQKFGVGKHITDDGHASGLEDVSPVALSCPSVSGQDLPVVHLGFPFDQACDIADWVGLGDPRHLVTQWIVGDIPKARTHEAYWAMYGSQMASVSKNLAHGQQVINNTWRGDAATKSAAAMDRWVTATDSQSQAMTQMAGHVKDMVDQAMDMAQLVVDTIKFFISTISAGWSCAAIPFYGEWKLVKTVKEAWHLINDARKVISVFWSFLNVLKDAFRGLYDGFTATGLPAAPTAPATGH